MAKITIIATEKYVDNKYNRYDTVSSHHLEWRYSCGPWVNLTEDKAIETLRIWLVDEKEIQHMLHFARAFGELEFEIMPPTKV